MQNKILTNKKLIELYVKNSYSYFIRNSKLAPLKEERKLAIKRFLDSTR